MPRDEGIKFNKDQFDDVSSSYLGHSKKINDVKDEFFNALVNIENNWTGEGSDIDKRDQDFATIRTSLEIVCNDLHDMAEFLDKKNQAFTETKYRA